MLFWAIQIESGGQAFIPELNGPWMPLELGVNRQGSFLQQRKTPKEANPWRLLDRGAPSFLGEWVLPFCREIWSASEHLSSHAWLLPADLWAFCLLFLPSGNFLFAIYLTHKSSPQEISYQTKLFVMQIQSTYFSTVVVSIALPYSLRKSPIWGMVVACPTASLNGIMCYITGTQQIDVDSLKWDGVLIFLKNYFVFQVYFVFLLIKNYLNLMCRILWLHLILALFGTSSNVACYFFWSFLLWKMKYQITQVSHHRGKNFGQFRVFMTEQISINLRNAALPSFHWIALWFSDAFLESINKQTILKLFPFLLKKDCVWK